MSSCLRISESTADRKIRLLSVLAFVSVSATVR